MHTMRASTSGNMELREPAVAGMFYPARKDEAIAQLEQCFAQIKQREMVPKAIIVPHAGWAYSGRIAAHAFALLKNTSVRKFVLLGPSHYVYLEDVAQDDHTLWRTPLGTVPLAPCAFRKDGKAHAPEHCLEVEVPFLQHLFGNVTLIPLLAGDIDPREVYDRIIPLLDDALLIVSTDLSHFHMAQDAVRRDKRTIAAIEALDYDAMLKHGDACGKIPVLISLLIGKKLGWKCKLLASAHSGDVTHDNDRVVGYASFALW